MITTSKVEYLATLKTFLKMCELGVAVAGPARALHRELLYLYAYALAASPYVLRGGVVVDIELSDLFKHANNAKLNEAAEASLAAQAEYARVMEARVGRRGTLISDGPGKLHCPAIESPDDAEVVVHQFRYAASLLAFGPYHPDADSLIAALMAIRLGLHATGHHALHPHGADMPTIRRNDDEASRKAQAEHAERAVWAAAAATDALNPGGAVFTVHDEPGMNVSPDPVVEAAGMTC